MSNTNSIVIRIIVYQPLILNVIDEVINKYVEKQRARKPSLGAHLYLCSTSHSVYAQSYHVAFCLINKNELADMHGEIRHIFVIYTAVVDGVGSRKLCLNP